MECGECTLCCKLLNIPWMDSQAGELCRECDENKGCKIYDKAPKKCLEFHCAYNQMEKASIDLRPDKCNVIFERINDVFVGTVDPDKNYFQDIVEGQINSLLNEGFSIILFNRKEPKPIIIPSDKHTKEEAWNIVQMEVSKLNGST